jgi:hypothetical protein
VTASVGNVAASNIRGLIILTPPRGVSPKYSLIEIDDPSHNNEPPLLIDPNYFTASSLETFINAPSERRPDIEEGKERTH